jgi:hypothetical protein
LTAPRREEERQARYTVLNPPCPITRDENPAVTDSISAHANCRAAPPPTDEDDPGSSVTREPAPRSRLLPRTHGGRQHPGSIFFFQARREVAEPAEGRGAE